MITVHPLLVQPSLDTDNTVSLNCSILYFAILESTALPISTCRVETFNFYKWKVLALFPTLLKSRNLFLLNIQYFDFYTQQDSNLDKRLCFKVCFCEELFLVICRPQSFYYGEGLCSTSNQALRPCSHCHRLL